jgi:hypothetical protein
MYLLSTKMIPEGALETLESMEKFMWITYSPFDPK